MLGDLNEDEVAEILQSNMVGRIGCTDGEKVYVVPVSYIIVDGYALCHSRLGMKIEMMRKYPSVCFEVDEVLDYNNWRCVIAWGNYVELLDEDEIKQAKHHFSDYMLTTKTGKTTLPPETQGERTHDGKVDFENPVFYRIEFTRITGRFEQQT